MKRFGITLWSGENFKVKVPEDTRFPITGKLPFKLINDAVFIIDLDNGFIVKTRNQETDSFSTKDILSILEQVGDWPIKDVSDYPNLMNFLRCLKKILIPEKLS